jgi:pimeloyl-ACP methyl ester carboxylesterase
MGCSAPIRPAADAHCGMIDRMTSSASSPAMPPLEPALLPSAVRAGFVRGVNGLDMHVLEAGEPIRPAGPPSGQQRCVLLLHGFPELAYSWRKVMPALADAGYHVVAPDQRGYGRTTGWDPRYDGDLGSYRLINLVRDAIGLVAALGYRSVDAVVGHDFGSIVAAWCALLRPDVFGAAVMMSAPFAGPPALPFDTAHGDAADHPEDIHAALAALPRPRKHYQWYYAGRDAATDMDRPPQGMHDFLRAYYHHKSGDWPGNRPFELAAWRADELQKLPTYYVMNLAEDMPQTVAQEMPSLEVIAANQWLPDPELRVYSGEFTRTGFQGALQWYRNLTEERMRSELQLWSGRTIDVPSCFIAGERDWGIHQRPGDLARMQGNACTRMSGVHLVPGAGHWVQQERPDEVNRLLLAFLASVSRPL